MADFLDTATTAFMKPFRKVAGTAKARRPDNDDDPLEADFQRKAGNAKADPFDTAFGGVPHFGRRGKDIDNQKRGE